MELELNYGRGVQIMMYNLDYDSWSRVLRIEGLPRLGVAVMGSRARIEIFKVPEKNCIWR